MSSAMVGNGYQQNYNTYNGQPAPSHGQNYNTYNGQPPPDHGQNVITTGLLSYSDERHQKVQEFLGYQRQKEYNQMLHKQEGYYEPHQSSRPPANEQQFYRSSPSQPQSVQTSPRRGVFYRLVSPEVGLPLGRYEERRKSLDDQRQRDYFEMMSQKEKKEHQKRQEESMKKQAHVQKLQMQPEQKLYNYDEVQKSLREERRKEYDEFVPMGGLPRRGKYDPALHGQTLAEQKYREYLGNQLSEEESDSSDELDINEHSNHRKSRHYRDGDPEEENRLTPLPWDKNLFEGKHTDEFLARGGIPRRRKQKYTRKSGRAKERKHEYMAFLQSKLLAVKKQIESEMKELQKQSEEEEEENTEDEQDGQKKAIRNRKKKLSKRKNIPRELIHHQRGLQTPPWAEHFDVKEIKTTDKIGHGNETSTNLSEPKGILEEQPWYQNHQKNRKAAPTEKEASKSHHHHEKYESRQLSQSEGRSWSNNKNDLDRSHGRNRRPHNQTDEAKLNGQKDSYPVQKGPPNGSFPVQTYHQNSSVPTQEGRQTGSYPENKGQRSGTGESENHLWNNTRRMQYNKNHPWNKQQSQDLSLEDYESQSHQRENRSYHPSQQGERRQSRGHLDKGQRVEGGQDEGLQRNYVNEKQGSPRRSQERKNYQSDRGQWDKGQWDEGQLSKAPLENKEEIDYHDSNGQKEEDMTEEGKNFDDFMPFGGMLRRRKVDPVTLKAEFLEETRKNYQQLTMKLKEEQSKLRPVPTPPGGLDVGQNDLYRQHLKDDLMREYQASLKKQQKEKLQLQLARAQQELSSSSLGPAPLPVKPVEIFNPEKARQQLQDDRKNDYNEILREKEQNPSPRRMPTPPHGLDIVSQSERTRQAREKQRLYGQELQKQTQEQMFKKIQNNISVIDRTGQLPPAPSQYNQVAPQQHGMAPPQASPSSRNIAPPHPPQQTASPPQHQMLPPPQHSQMVPQSTQPQFMLPPQSPKKPPPLHHTQFDESQYMDHHVAAPTGSHSPPPRQRSRPTPQRTEHGYHQEFNGKQQSPMESRDGHRPPPHPRRHATPDRPEWARGPPPRQNGTPTGRASLRRDDRQTPSYWNSGMPVRSPATTPSTRTPSTQHSNRTLTPKDSQDNIPDIHLESYRKNPFEEFRRGERKKEYNDFLIQKEIKAQSKREELEQLRRQAPVQPKYDNYSSSDNHQRHKKHLETERHEQYQSFLSQNGEPVYTNTRTSELTQSRLSGGLVGGIFGDVQHEQDRRRVMVQQRNKEYNQLKKQSNSREPTEEFDRTVPQLGLPLDNERSNELRRRQEKVRNREYRKFLEESVMNNSREQPHEPSRRGPEFGLPLDNRKSNELRRQQERDRNQEYRSFLEEKKRSPRRYQPPTPEDKQGLPLTQRPYDERKVFNERQRNMEYNQYLAKSGLPFDKMSLQGSVQGSAVARQANDLQTDTEPPTPQKRYPSKKHDREVTHRVEDEKKLPPKPIVRHIPSGKSDVDVNFENQKAFPMGNDYAEKQKKLREEWRKSYEAQKDKIRREDDARSRREETFRDSWERSMESPPIVPAGTYDQKREKIRQGLQADYQVYLASQQPANRSKEFWSSSDNPKIYPTSGEYKRRGEKMKEELREEFHVFMDKQEPPKERKKVFGEQGSVLFVSQYPDTRKHMNAERKRDMLEHLEKKKGEVPRKQGDPSMDEKNMFSDMGKSQEAHKKRIQENAKQDYRNYVNHAFPEGLNRGEPTFAAGKAPPDSWYDAQPPTHRRSPPRDFRPEPENHQRHSHDAYAERLQQARANEAMYRKHDPQMNDHRQRQSAPRQEQAPYALY